MAFDAKKFIRDAVPGIRRTIGREKAICAVSGGVDSSASAVLTSRAIGKNLFAICIDTGFMREDEPKKVRAGLKKLGIELRIIDASERFFNALSGVTDPEQKRRIIGENFIRVFEEAAKESGVTFLVQGTIAPDVIESGGLGRDRIKSHHNVAGLPSGMKLKLCEPLRDLYKHEVRMVGKELGLPQAIYERQPFPGPGLAIRVIGELTREKVDIEKRINAIVEEEIEKAVTAREIERPWQYFASLLPTKAVGVKGDERSYHYVAVIRCVRSLDGMTANFSRIPPHVLERISTRITNQVGEVGRVLYDVTNKPPATIEME